MFQFTWPFCTTPMFKFGPRGFQNWFYIHCSSNQKKVPSGQTFFPAKSVQIGVVDYSKPLCRGSEPMEFHNFHPISLSLRIQTEPTQNLLLLWHWNLKNNKGTGCLTKCDHQSCENWFVFGIACRVGQVIPFMDLGHSGLAQSLLNQKKSVWQSMTEIKGT